MALPLVQLVNVLIPKVARDVQLINFLGTISETFCVSLLQMRVHHIEYTKHEVILKKKRKTNVTKWVKSTPKTRFSETRFSEILNLMNKIQLPFS